MSDTIRVSRELLERAVAQLESFMGDLRSGTSDELRTLLAQPAADCGLEVVAWQLGCQTMGGDVGYILSWSQSGAGLCNRLHGEEYEVPLVRKSDADDRIAALEGDNREYAELNISLRERIAELYDEAIKRREDHHLHQARIAELEARVAELEGPMLAWAELDYTKHTRKQLMCYIGQQNFTITALQKMAEKRAAASPKPPVQEPICYVTGYYGGRCVVKPVNNAAVLPTNMALYAATPAADADALQSELNEKRENICRLLIELDAVPRHGHCNHGPEKTCWRCTADEGKA